MLRHGGAFRTLCPGNESDTGHVLHVSTELGDLEVTKFTDTDSRRVGAWAGEGNGDLGTTLMGRAFPGIENRCNSRPPESNNPYVNPTRSVLRPMLRDLRTKA